MKLPMREEVEAVRETAGAADGSGWIHRWCDFVLAVLDAPEHILTREERETWGICKVCGAKHGEECRPLINSETKTLDTDGYPASREDLAPRKVRMVPVP